MSNAIEQTIHIQTPDEVVLEGDLEAPEGARGMVLFAHGSGSSRFSPRNRSVARELHRAGLGTLLVDLLTPREESIDQHTMHLRFDIGMLAGRLVGAADWLAADPRTRALPLGLFGASTGAAAALIAAARQPQAVAAVVSRGGRPDLAGDELDHVEAPVLLIVGGRDLQVLHLNEQALARLVRSRESRLEIVPGATHLFEEPGALETVSDWAADWFARHLAPA